MIKKYDIYFDSKIVGTASIERQGLYYLIDCICTCATNEIHRVSLRTLGAEINLGVCIPAGDMEKTKAKIAAKLIDPDDLHFHIVPNNENKSAIHLVYEGCIFPAVSQIRCGIFTREEGSVHIKIQDPVVSFQNSNQ